MTISARGASEGGDGGGSTANSPPSPSSAVAAGENDAPGTRVNPSDEASVFAIEMKIAFDKAMDASASSLGGSSSKAGGRKENAPISPVCGNPPDAWVGPLSFSSGRNSIVRSAFKMYLFEKGGCPEEYIPLSALPPIGKSIRLASSADAGKYTAPGGSQRPAVLPMLSALRCQSVEGRPRRSGR